MNTKTIDAMNQARAALANVCESQSNPSRPHLTIHDFGQCRLADIALRVAIANEESQPPETVTVTCQTYGHVVGACAECNTHAEADVNETNSVLASRYFDLLKNVEKAQTVEPVGVVDEGDDGLFVDLETAHGVMVKRGDKLFTRQATPAQDVNAELVEALANVYREIGKGGSAHDIYQRTTPILLLAMDAAKAAPADGVVDTDGVFPNWKPGGSNFKHWCSQHFGPDADESYLAEAVLQLPRKQLLPMMAADEFELRRLLAEERYTVRQLSRSLRESIDGPIHMGEPVLQAPQPVPQGEREALIARIESWAATLIDTGKIIDDEGDATRDFEQAADMLAADAQWIAELEALSVTNILLAVVPGDGSGLEVYAKSVADVEDLLTKMSEDVEDFQGAQQVAVPQEPIAHICILPTKDAGPTKFFTAPSDPRGFPVYAAPKQKQNEGV